MNFGTNETPAQVIKEGAFDQTYYCSDYYDISVNKYGIKYGTSLRF